MAITLLGLWLLLLSYAKDLPSTSSLVQYKPSLVTQIYDIHGKIIDELYIEHRNLVPLRDIPVDLQNAVIATEDANFFNHWGLDIMGVFRAFTANLKAGHVVQGGSTITQQLAKVMFLTPKRTLKRKIKELMLAIYIERTFSKEEILQFYLNQIYFGEGAYGVETASKIYFNKSVEDLNLSECAMLAGLPRAPTSYSPSNNIYKAYRRRAIVLSRLKKLNLITEEERINANCRSLSFKTSKKEERAAPYFVEQIRKTLLPELGANMLYKGGLRIYTTLDMDIQKTARETVLEFLQKFDDIKKRELKKEKQKELGLGTIDEVELSTSDFKPVQGALIAIDPRNGQVRAMVGGRDFQESEFNRAIQAKRQPGSGFKPFIYTAAIDNGFTAASILEDKPRVYYNDGVNWKLLANTTSLHQLNIDFNLLQKLKNITKELEEDEIPGDTLDKIEELNELKEKVWAPQNYSKKFHGNVTLRNGIVKSINVATINLISKIRPVTALYYAHKMGIRSSLPRTLSLGLGSGELAPIEMASAFSVFANNGIKTKPYFITKIEDYSGNIIKENYPVEEQVLSPQTNYIMVNLMQQVCKYGTGWYTKRLKRPHAGKTGTTNDFSDAWFTGYVPNLSASVWVGYDDRSTLGDRKVGGVVAAPIWTKFMQEALVHTPELDFPVPDGIKFVNFDPDTGKLATEYSENTILQPFVKGTEPKDYF